MAPLPMPWTGKNDNELCMLMKRFEPTGENFVDHLETDHKEIQFIKAAFHGDRALGTALEGKPEPPPGTQAELVDKARKWVKLVVRRGTRPHPSVAASCPRSGWKSTTPRPCRFPGDCRPGKRRRSSSRGRDCFGFTSQ